MRIFTHVARFVEGLAVLGGAVIGVFLVALAIAHYEVVAMLALVFALSYALGWVIDYV